MSLKVIILLMTIAFDDNPTIKMIADDLPDRKYKKWWLGSLSCSFYTASH